jgi:hypothetical protein
VWHQGDSHACSLDETIEHVGAKCSLTLKEEAKHISRDTSLAGDLIERTATSVNGLANVTRQGILGRCFAHTGIAICKFRQLLPNSLSVALHSRKQLLWNLVVTHGNWPCYVHNCRSNIR